MKANQVLASVILAVSLAAGIGACSAMGEPPDIRTDNTPSEAYGPVAVSAAASAASQDQRPLCYQTAEDDPLPRSCPFTPSEAQAGHYDYRNGAWYAND
jgi:hypothetical protein